MMSTAENQGQQGAAQSQKMPDTGRDIHAHTAAITKLRTRPDGRFETILARGAGQNGKPLE
jgi:hypothetical protein